MSKLDDLLDQYGDRFDESLGKRSPEPLGIRLVLESKDDIVGEPHDDDIAAIVELHGQMRQLFDSRDRLSYYKLNQAIHAAIVGLTGNQTLIATHEMLQMRLRRIRYVGNEQPASWSGASVTAVSA